MKRVSKLVGIVSKPLQRSYLCASPTERESLLPVIEQESHWMIERMAGKGYQLEGRVAEVYGLFTRGTARGTLRIVREAQRSREPQAAGV